MGRGSFSGGFFKRSKHKKTKSSPASSSEGGAPNIIDWDHEKCRPIYSSSSNSETQESPSLSLDDTDDGDNTDDMNSSGKDGSDESEVGLEAEKSDDQALVSRWDKEKSRRYGGRGLVSTSTSVCNSAANVPFLSDDELSLNNNSSPREGRTSICCSMDGSDDEKENSSGAESSGNEEEEFAIACIAKKRSKQTNKRIRAVKSGNKVNGQKVVVLKKMFGGKKRQKMLIKSKRKTPVSVKKSKNNDLDFPEKTVTQPSCNSSLSAAKAFFDQLDESHPLVISSQSSPDEMKLEPISRKRKAFGKRRDSRISSPVCGNLRLDSIVGP